MQKFSTYIKYTDDLQVSKVFCFNGDASVYSRLSEYNYFEGNGQWSTRLSIILKNSITLLALYEKFFEMLSGDCLQLASHE